MKKKTARLCARVVSLVLAFSCLVPTARAAQVEAQAFPQPTPTPVTTVWGYQEGYAQAERGGLWGFAGPSGEIVIQPIYRSVVSFTLGLAMVNLNGKLGVIRPDGKYLIQPEYDTLWPVDCGLYIAQKGINWGVVSILPATGADGQTTQEIYPLEYASVTREVSGGVDALVLTGKEGAKTVVPLYRLPAILSEMGVPGYQFPLTRGKLPSFSDVSPRAWYSLWVDIAYNTGLMSGTGGGDFLPDKPLTVAECLQMAANMDSRYRGDNFHTTTHGGTPWYQAAVDYCLACSIISPGQFEDYQREVTRREMALIFGATALARSLPNRNSLARIAASVRDVSPLESGSALIYSLYAKGILTGVDNDLSFRPDAPLTRAEAAALAARLARPEQRVDLF